MRACDCGQALQRSRIEGFRLELVWSASVARVSAPTETETCPSTSHISNISLLYPSLKRMRFESLGCPSETLSPAYKLFDIHLGIEPL